MIGHETKCILFNTSEPKLIFQKMLLTTLPAASTKGMTSKPFSITPNSGFLNLLLHHLVEMTNISFFFSITSFQRLVPHLRFLA